MGVTWTRRFHFVTSVIVLCASFVIVEHPISSGANAVSPTLIVAKALHNAIASGWVHEVVVAKSPGLTTRIVEDLGTNEGQRAESQSDGGSFSELNLGPGTDGYAELNSSFVGVLSQWVSNSGQYANEWLEIPPTSPAYVLTSNTTLRSVFTRSHLLLSHTLKLGAISKINGQLVQAISSTVPASGGLSKAFMTLYVSTRGNMRPVELREVLNGGYTETQTWTDWGITVTINRPNSAVLLPTN